METSEEVMGGRGVKYRPLKEKSFSERIRN